MLPHELTLELIEVADRMGLPIGEWKGLDDFLPLLERMREDGAVVVVKLDGQRTAEDDAPPYTVVLSGGHLGNDYVTVGAVTLPEALARATLGYAAQAWPRE